MTRTPNHWAAASLWTRRTAFTIAIVGASLLPSSPRSATAAALPSADRFHLALSRAEPRVNDTVSVSPKVIKLWFTESVQSSGTSVRLTGPENHAITIGEVTVAAAAKSPAIVAVTEKLKPGTYTVAWKAMASDGHPNAGKFTFTLRAPSGR
jgi:methionine-rich copper-binding protein CopC